MAGLIKKWLGKHTTYNWNQLWKNATPLNSGPTYKHEQDIMKPGHRQVHCWQKDVFYFETFKSTVQSLI